MAPLLARTPLRIRGRRSRISRRSGFHFRSVIRIYLFVSPRLLAPIVLLSRACNPRIVVLPPRTTPSANVCLHLSSHPRANTAFCAHPHSMRPHPRNTAAQHSPTTRPRLAGYTFHTVLRLSWEPRAPQSGTERAFECAGHRMRRCDPGKSCPGRLPPSLRLHSGR
ncbi:hypothetical protein DFH09DRAFT_272661 [Mycena vulgaris]|nr:hypothetical protein DFH09DRAFT_272661 [Mycena vulgaris]